MNRFALPHSRLWILAGLVLAGMPTSHAAENKGMTFSGLGWVQYGIVEKSTDTVGLNANGNALQTIGAQIFLSAGISEQLKGKAGLGVIENLPLTGGISNGGRVPTNVTPYIAEASFNYSFWNSERSELGLTGGLFPYNYNPDVRNLGLYLLRGPVYPGVVISGFETKAVLPISNMLGFQLRHAVGGFQQDLILNSENELHPYFDISPAYLAQYQWGKAFRIGAGVNFYHLIPIDKKLTSPPKDAALLNERKETSEAQARGPYDRVMIYVDSSSGAADTTMLSFQGTKVMANFSWDPKALFGGSEILGAEDLKIYGELAVIGLNTSKAYNALYGDLKHRMPIMMGFNLPAFRLLDHLALEVEWYGAKFRDDYSRYSQGAAYYESPIPVSNKFANRNPQRFIDPVSGDTSLVVTGTNIPFDEADVEKNQSKDNWKWSLHGSRIIQDHFRISFQIANDHLRPGGAPAQPTKEAILTTMKDWYWMSKVSYFF
jgi:hypothetical protein